jgi:hypothetical protein
MMAGDDKKSKSPEKAGPKDKAPAKADAKTDTKADAKTETKADAKTDTKPDAKSEAPKNYSRGEGQKPVSQAYKDNWNAIFGKKSNKKRL